MNIKQESPLKYSKPLIFSSVEIFPHKTSANSAESYPIPSHLYFANLAKYTEMSTSPMMNNSLCAVCEDVCSGKHYGVLSCNGCSGFFKRTVRRQLIYYCQNNSNMCIIDKAHRNQCQACRFKKCLQMGMIKEAVQNERQRRTTERAMSILHPDSSEQTNIISKIKQDEYTSVNHLNDSISTEILLMMIKWIRNIPIFLNLSIDDQLILFEESWSDLFLLWIIQYSMIFNDENQFFHSIKSINDISEVFKQFQVNPMEFDCLKTIVLFRTDIQRLKDIKTIENLQDQALTTLAQLTFIHKPTRFGRLLLTLSLLRRIPSIFIEKTYFRHLIHHTSIAKLLVNMLENEKNVLIK